MADAIDIAAAWRARALKAEAEATSPFVVLGRGLAAACDAHDLRPGEVVQFTLVPHIWDALQKAREVLRVSAQETPP